MSNIYDEAVGKVAGWWTYAFGGGSDLQSTGDSLDAQLNQLNSVDYSPGGRLYNEIEAERGRAAADAAWDQVQADERNGATGNVLDQEIEAGTEGAREGRQGITDFVWKAIKDTFGIVPWWGWIFIVGGLFVYAGGLPWILRRLKGVFAK